MIFNNNYTLIFRKDKFFFKCFIASTKAVFEINLFVIARLPFGKQSNYYAVPPSCHCEAFRRKAVAISIFTTKFVIASPPKAGVAISFEIA